MSASAKVNKFYLRINQCLNLTPEQLAKLIKDEGQDPSDIRRRSKNNPFVQLLTKAI